MDEIDAPKRMDLLSPYLVIFCVAAFSAALMPVIALRYGYNALSLAVCGGGFLILTAVSVFLWRLRRSLEGEDVGRFAHATRVGIGLGLLWVCEIGVNNFIAPPLPARDIIDDIFWAVIALGIFLCAAFRSFVASKVLAGITVGTWAGSVSGLFACSMALSMVVFGMGFITRDPLNIAEWASRQGAHTTTPNMAVYFAFETVAGGFLHLIVLGIGMGLILGILGGQAGWLMRLAASRFARKR